MSWIEKIQDVDMTIKTGDGKTFTVSYFTASVSRNVNYNISEFLFKNIKGSLVKRGQPRGTQYELEFRFVGDKNLDDAAKFKKSSENPNPWTIQHPMYGGLYVQPVSLLQDNALLNVSAFKCVVIETLTDSGAAKTIVSPKYKIAADAAKVMQAATAKYSEVVYVQPLTQLQVLQNTINGAYSKVFARINSIAANLAVYQENFNAANAVINSTVYNALEVAAAVQQLLVTPAYFAASIKSRVEMFEAVMDILSLDINSILSAYNVKLKPRKTQYELSGSSCITGMCIASITNITNDYGYRPNVLDITNRIVAQYNLFIANLDLIQSDNGGDLDGYFPDAATITNLNFLVNFTVSTLLDISTGAKQKRTKYIIDETNIILLADELYGMQADDSTIDTLITTNNIQLSEIFFIKQGREIVYYV